MSGFAVPLWVPTIDGQVLAMTTVGSTWWCHHVVCINSVITATFGNFLMTKAIILGRLGGITFCERTHAW